MTKEDLAKLADHELAQLIVGAARELATREEQMQKRLVLEAACGYMAFAHATLAAYYCSEQVMAAAR